MIRLVPELEVPENPTAVWPECDVMLPRDANPGDQGQCVVESPIEGRVAPVVGPISRYAVRSNPGFTA
jgi:hypothetical protein